MANTRVLENGTDVRVLQNGTDTRVTEPVQYTMIADVGSLVETGINATLRAARFLVATIRSWAETGTAATLQFGRKLPATSRSWALAGVAIAFHQTSILAVTPQSFGITGTAAAFRQVRAMRADIPLEVPDDLTATATGIEVDLAWNEPTTFDLVDISTTLAQGYRLFAASGSFLRTDINAEISKTPPSLPVQLALVMPRDFQFSVDGTTVTLSWQEGYSYTIVGLDVSLAKARSLAAGIGTFTATGLSAGMTEQERINPAQGSFTLSQIATSLKYSRKLPATIRSWALTGTSANLVHTQAGDYLLTADSRALTVTPVSAGFVRTYRLPAVIRSLAITGLSADLSIPAGVLTLTYPLVLYLESGETTLTLNSGEKFLDLESGETRLDLGV